MSKKNWSIQGQWVFWEISGLIQLDSWFFKHFHLFKRCVKFRKIPPNFSKLQWRTPRWKKQMLITTEMTLDLSSWKRTGPKILSWPPESVHFEDFFKGFRHPKLSSLEKRHPGKSSCDGYSQWMWCTCACTITSWNFLLKDGKDARMPCLHSTGWTHQINWC